MALPLSLPLPATAAQRRRSTALRNPSIRLQSFAQLGTLQATQNKNQDIDSQAANTTQTPSIRPIDAAALEEDVRKAVRINRSFCLPLVAPDIELTDLPNLESITDYGVSENVEENLWDKEVARLVQAVTNNTPLEFTGSEDLVFDTVSSYDVLASVAEQIWQAVHIDLYDAGNVLAEHCPDLVPSDMKLTRRIMEHFCTEDNNAKLRQPMTPERRQDFFNLLDYCTAIIARVVWESAEGKSLHINTLAHLARLSTKLKVLSAKLLEFSEKSLGNTVADVNFDHAGYTGLRGRPDKFNDNLDNPDLNFLRGLRNMNGPLKESETATKEGAVRELYFAQCCKFRFCLHHCLRTILLSLKGTSQLTQKSLSSYEICATVYESGFEGFPILVFQDSKDDLIGTSDASHLDCAGSGFHVLDQTVRHVQAQMEKSSSGPKPDNHSPPESGNGSVKSKGDDIDGSMGTSIYWSYRRNGRNIQDTSQGLLRLRSMSHVIMVIIPLLMIRPSAVNSIQSLVDLAIYTEHSEERLINPVMPKAYGKYTAFFSLSTADYRKTQDDLKPEDAKSLSNALMLCDNLYMGDSLGQFPSSVPSGTDHASTQGRERTAELVKRRRVELDNMAQSMEGWVFEEKGVMVQCRKYVLSCMFTCFVLVIGGLAVGASLGERLSGVDPFNITTYSWVLAAFLLLVAKSIRVQNWPWNDFLHGRVLCKSVSELSSVTGIDEQFIFVKLLQDERESFLETRGPFNVIFNRRSQDGFSIDRPISMWAMLLSGLIMVETESVRGRSLVCLDLRLGTKIRLIERLGMAEIVQDEKYIHQTRVSDDKSRSHNVEATKIRLTEGKTEWLRTVGLFANREARFI
ncbi:hypothetical protein F5Y14DRAFT_434790 [Nemania sp. NC0429]|nr:hypothetical protein F5Y14DRAFT_434790 [Nemania sp. NC0429]